MGRAQSLLSRSLARRKLVVLTWVAVALATASTASLTTRRLDQTFTLPGGPANQVAHRL